jgi:hypothetical protein
VLALVTEHRYRRLASGPIRTVRRTQGPRLHLVDSATAEPPLGLWAYNSGAFDDRSSGSPTGQFGPPQPPIGFWAVVSGLGGVAVTPSPTVQVGEPSTLGGSKPHKKRRGPYSDPKIFEEYIKRCIAEREQPRVSVQAAVLKEALVHEVEERTETAYAERDALLRENQILEQLLAFETAKRDLQAIRARQRQIDRQLRDIESDEVSFLLAVFEEM